MDMFLQADFNEGENVRVRGRVGRKCDRSELIGRPHMGKEETWENPSSNIDAS